jgi:hypothetical protein
LPPFLQKTAREQVDAGQIEGVAPGTEIELGDVHKPTWKDLLVIQMFWFWPIGISKWTYSSCRWIYRRRVLKADYDAEEREYLTRTAMELDQNRWTDLGKEKQEELISKELWAPGNMDKYKVEQEEHFRTKYPAKYKRYQRQMKKEKSGKGVKEM